MTETRRRWHSRLIATTLTGLFLAGLCSGSARGEKGRAQDAALEGGREAFRYPEGEHGKGRLKYINGLPVLVVAGSAEEMGEQYGVLALRPARGILEYPVELMKTRGLEAKWPLLVAMGKAMLTRFPEHHRAELAAMSKFSEVDHDLLVAVNTIDDPARLAQCSSLMVEGERSATGAPLFGRNLDYEAVGHMREYALVIVYRPEGGRAFASVGFPGLIGCLSGINDAGLALATHSVSSTSDGAPTFDRTGTPMLVTFRRILEECATVAEAEELLRSAKQTTLMNLAVCDTQRAVVFELTPRSMMVRRSEGGMLACTNHFQTKELTTGATCWRYEKLQAYMASERLSLADVAEAMRAVNQGDATLQTMIFEPEGLRLRLSFGSRLSSPGPLKELALDGLW